MKNKKNEIRIYCMGDHEITIIIPELDCGLHSVGEVIEYLLKNGLKKIEDWS